MVSARHFFLLAFSMTGRVVLTCIDIGPGGLERAHLSYYRHPLASRGKILHPLFLLFQISWSVNKGTDTGHCFLFLGRRSHNAVYNLMINRIYSRVIMVKVKPLILLSKARTSAWTDLCDPLTQVRDTQQHNRSWHCTVQHTDQDADINDRSPAPGSCQQIWSVFLINPQSKKYHRHLMTGRGWVVLTTHLQGVRQLKKISCKKSKWWIWMNLGRQFFILLSQFIR